MQKILKQYFLLLKSYKTKRILRKIAYVEKKPRNIEAIWASIGFLQEKMKISSKIGARQKFE